MERIHFIGIGGTGLSAIARLLAQRGVAVSGSDRALSPLAQELIDEGIPVTVGHAAENVAGATLVVRSSAIPDDNPEVLAAQAAGIPVLKRSEYLPILLKDQTVIAVAGTHGKTTTTAMLAWVLTRLGLDPSYVVGGVPVNLGKNAHAGQGTHFVIEADEYDRMFLGLDPAIAVVTYMEHDHPDCFPTMEDYQAAFEQFVGRIKPGGSLLTSGDKPATFELAFSVPVGVTAFTYALDAPAHYRITRTAVNEWGGFSGEAFAHGTSLGLIELQAPGRHNLANALAALAVAHRLGLDLAAARAALRDFSGVGRRFQVLGEPRGITVIDDYAHHPTEIRAVLAAAKARYPARRIWVVWQPHTFTRTAALADQFRTAFRDANRVVVSSVYGAREAAETISIAELVAQMDHPNAQYIPSLDGITAHLLAELRQGDVLLVLSAGDADQVSAAVLNHFSKGS